MPTSLRVLLICSAGDATALLDALALTGAELIWRRVDDAPALESALAEPWNVVLCDWQLVDLAGPEAVVLVRDRVDAPILVVSGALGDAAVAAAFRAGARNCLISPSPAQLRTAVDHELRDAEYRRARERTEAALRASEQRFAKAFDYAPIGMALVGIDGTTLKVNRAFCDMLGYAESELVQIPVWRFTHPDDMPATIEQLQRLIENEIDAWYLEKRFFHRDGHLLWGRSTTWLVRDANGAPQYVVSQVQDVTHSKRLEEQMRRQEAELAHAQRLATMGETVAQIAHEVNQPLASIANFANGLVTRWDRDAVDPATSRSVAVQIADEALRASAVIRRLRDFLSKGEAKRATCDVNLLVRDTLRLIEAEMRQNAIRLEVVLAEGAVPAAVDRVQMGQVLLNLVRNAVDALLPQPATDRELAIGTALSSTGDVAVTVRDTGVGLPDVPEEIMFEPFFTTKQNGLGLGLSISRSIVRAHGGTLWAQRNPRCGATVGFTLPADCG